MTSPEDQPAKKSRASGSSPLALTLELELELELAAIVADAPSAPEATSTAKQVNDPSTGREGISGNSHAELRVSSSSAPRTSPSSVTRRAASRAWDRRAQRTPSSRDRHTLHSTAASVGSRHRIPTGRWDSAAVEKCADSLGDAAMNRRKGHNGASPTRTKIKHGGNHTT